MSKAKEVIDVAAENTNLPVNIEDQIRKSLEAQKGQLGSLPSNKIATKGKEFTLPDGQSSPGPLEAVVLDFVWFMVNYPGVYNSNNPQQPNCFAIGRDNPDGGSLKPHESSAEPQHENCRECPKNQWKSAPSGNGKACKNQRRLVLLPPNAGEDSEPMTLYVSPGALKNFDAYVARLQNEHGILPVQAITEISFDKNQSYPSLQFAFKAKHDNLNLFWAKREQAQALLMRPLETEKEKS
jgi:hypothetical protein